MFSLGCCCSVTKSCMVLGDPTVYSTPGSFVLHYLPEFLLNFMSFESGILTTSFSDTFFSFCLQTCPSIRVFSNESTRLRPYHPERARSRPMSQLFSSGGQSIGVSALALVYDDEDEDDGDNNTLVVA